MFISHQVGLERLNAKDKSANYVIINVEVPPPQWVIRLWNTRQWVLSFCLVVCKSERNVNQHRKGQLLACGNKIVSDYFKVDQHIMHIKEKKEIWMIKVNEILVKVNEIINILNTQLLL